jgi:hypothetical protein
MLIINYLIFPTLGVPDEDGSTKLLSAAYKLRKANDI